MRFLSVIATLLVFTSCASHQSHEDRKPASADSSCKIQKHHKNDWYRLTVDGKPAFKSWYTQSQVKGHLSSYMKNGKCN